MKLSVPFNGQDNLLPQLVKYPEVVEIYGKLNSDFIGGGKHSFQIPFISKSRFAYNVRQAHYYGFKFNYLLNSSCLNNLEWTIIGQKKIFQLIDWLINLNIDTVTIATPYLLSLIKKRYPSLKVSISDLAYVNTLPRAKYWENLGADCITLFNIDVNRNFALIKHIRNNIKCELKLIANANCLYGCPFYMYHANIASHASQSKHILRGFVIDYCRIICRYQQIIEPVNFIRSTWIRPEDIGYYEKMAVDSFKIIDRGMTTEAILSIADAYIKRHYGGNLLDLFPDPSKSILFTRSNWLLKLKYFFRPFTVNIFKLRKYSNLINSGAVYIDNNKLEGFISNISNIDCGKTICEKCGYCHGIAKNAIYIDNEKLKRLKEHYKICLDEIVSGDLFKYF